MNLYNDIDPKACAWTKELIKANLIPPGTVICKSITDLTPSELEGYTQYHFFNGISGWARALDIAGWPATRPVWCASLPCQSFSCAGQGKGFDDERGQLWLPFLELVKTMRPVTIIGEQVPAAIGHGWLDRVFTDLEREGYSCGAVVLGAHSVGAPHIRQRLNWVAHSQRDGRGPDFPRREQERGIADGRTGSGPADTQLRRPQQRDTQERGIFEPHTNGSGSGMEHTESNGRVERWTESNRGSVAGRCASGGVGNADIQGPQGRFVGRDGTRERAPGQDGVGFWSDAIWHQCRDGKSRRIPNIEPVFQRVVDVVSEGVDPVRIASNGFPLAQIMKGRVGLLKGYGNAIVPEASAEFVKACLDIL